MKTIETALSMTRASDAWRKEGRAIGFVPTMGALHAGHASLIERARRECGRVVVSIFVNPTQFGPGEDFSRYPRTWDADRKLCAAAGADAVFRPSAEEIYPDGFKTFVEVSALSDKLCGAFRPGHFRGVATVVLKLFQAVRPDRAYFGEKDYQQLVIIKTMTRDLGLPVEIVGCPTVRERDGLALSSRNRYLSPDQRSLAPRLHAALEAGAARARAGASPRDAEAAVRAALRRITGAVVDYAALVDAETLERPAKASGRLRLLAAVRLGGTRLIDNIPVSC